MAYKFQLGDAKLSGSVTTEGLDVSDNDITNAGDVALASLSKDGAGEIEVSDALRMSGTTAIEFTNGDVKIVNQAGSSLELHASGGSKLEVHSNKLEAFTALEMSGNSELRLRGSRQRIYSQGVDQLAIDVSGTEVLNLNGTRIQAAKHIEMSTNQELRLRGSRQRIYSQGTDQLAIDVSGSEMLNFQSARILVDNKLQMKDAQIFQVRSTVVESPAANQFKINNPESNGELQFEISGTRRATLSSTGIVINNQMSASTISLDSAAGIAGTSLEDNAGTLRLATSAAGNGLTGGGTNSLSVQRSGSDADAGIQVTTDGLRIHTNIAGNKTFDNNVTITGDLTVNGTQTILNVATMSVDDANIVVGDGGSGSIDGLGLSFGSAGGVQTLQTKDSSGTQKLGSSLPLSASTYYGDGSNLTGVSSDTATSVRFPGHSAVINSNSTISNEVSLVDSSAASVTLTMPDIASGDLGKMYIIKDVEGSGSAANFIQINSSSAGHPLDGNDSIKIESGYGAVNLIATSGSQGYRYIIF